MPDKNIELRFNVDRGLLHIMDYYNEGARKESQDGVRYHVPDFSIKATSGSGGCMNQPDKFIETWPNGKTQCEKVWGTGPVPRGTYFLRIKEIDIPSVVRAYIRRMIHGDWGSFRVRLHSISPQIRTEFFLHGGDKLGSGGCIDVGGGILGNPQTKKLLEYLFDHDGPQVLLHVYSGEDSWEKYEN